MSSTRSPRPDSELRIRAWTATDELVVELHAMTRHPSPHGASEIPNALRATAIRAALALARAVQSQGQEVDLGVRASLTALAELRYHMYLARRLGAIDLRQYRGACARHERATKCVRALLDEAPTGAGSREDAPADPLVDPARQAEPQ